MNVVIWQKSISNHPTYLPGYLLAAVLARPLSHTNDEQMGCSRVVLMTSKVYKLLLCELMINLHFGVNLSVDFEGFKWPHDDVIIISTWNRNCVSTGIQISIKSSDPLRCLCPNLFDPVCKQSFVSGEFEGEGSLLQQPQKGSKGEPIWAICL